MSPEEASKVAKDAADSLEALAASLRKSDNAVTAEVQSLQAALSSFSKQVAALRPESLVPLSESVTDLLRRLDALNGELDGGDAKQRLASVIGAVFKVKRYVDQEGLAYFKRMRKVSPQHRVVMVVVAVVLSLVGAASLGVVLWVRRLRERRARLNSRMLSSKALRGQKAFEVLESAQLTGQRKMGDDLAAPLANNTYSFLINISDATVEPSNGVFVRRDGALQHLKLNARTAEKLLELSFGGGVNCTFLLPEVPVYRWFTLHVAVADGMVRVYLDGELRRTFYLHTCGTAVPPQSGGTLEFGSHRNIGVRYFKYAEGEMESYAIKQEAYTLLREMQAQLQDAQKKACDV